MVSGLSGKVEPIEAVFRANPFSNETTSIDNVPSYCNRLAYRIASTRSKPGSRCLTTHSDVVVGPYYVELRQGHP